MAVTPSTMLALGTKAPKFALPDVQQGSTRTYDSLRSSMGTVVMFLCNHCPFVKHLIPVLPDLAREFQGRGVSFVAISSNDVVAYPQDAPEAMKVFASLSKFDFPYLFDESQEVARAYQAACTPDFYLFDAEDLLVYRGRFDESRPGSDIPVTGKDLRAALEAVLACVPIAKEQFPSVGCNIKWKE